MNPNHAVKKRRLENKWRLGNFLGILFVVIVIAATIWVIADLYFEFSNY